MTDFNNPYNFIPAPPPVTAGELVHRKPAGRHRWMPDLWSGRIGIRIEAVTPLLIPDGSGIKYGAENKHKAYRTRLRNGQPHLPITTLKGALRSAYEAITNSRFGVFEKHDERLAYRMNVKDGLRMVPARVDVAGGVKSLKLYFGTHPSGTWPTPVNGTYGPPGNLMYAAWLKSYGNRNGNVNQTTDSIRHGQKMSCALKKVRRGNFDFWEVTSCETSRATLDTTTPAYVSPNYVPCNTTLPPVIVEGYICETNQSIGKKHDERVFFTTDPAGPLTKAWDIRWDSAWEELIKNYQRQAEKWLQQREAAGVAPWVFQGKNIGKTSFSRHLYAKCAEKLKHGDLCYALCDDTGEISGLYPVMISRQLFDLPPRGLLPKELWPATKLEELSPADRVFGWIGEAEGAARGEAVTQHRGQIRIVETRFDEKCLAAFGGEKAIAEFAGGLPLAILGQPKPQQARFYVAENQQGGAQSNGLPKPQAGFAAGKGLRGRKVYPHQAPRSEDYWDASKALEESRSAIAQSFTKPGALTYPGHQPGMIYREYVRRSGSTVDPFDNRDQRQIKDHPNRDNQNRSIRDWIKPKCEFVAAIDVMNLSKVELGALLYLFCLGENRCLKIGGGKPLGFGSVRISLESLDVWTGKDKAESLTSLSPPNRQPLTAAAAGGKASVGFIQPFWKSIVTEYGDEYAKRASSVPFFKAFLDAAEGYAQGPTHYPRTDQWPNPAGENFDWFVENERQHEPRALPGLGAGANVAMTLHPRRNRPRNNQG